MVDSGGTTACDFDVQDETGAAVRLSKIVAVAKSGRKLSGFGSVTSKHSGRQERVAHGVQPGPC